ncbi:MAG: hypothetical protein QNK19_07435 [Xanthomonadales bacterium]|nr:hypothetical protein [Xanthomonadales bacterium]
MPYYISPPPQNPLTRILTAIIAVFALVGFLMLGMVALLVVAGVGLVAGLVLWVRVAWVKRRLQKSGVDFSSVPGEHTESGDVIDAEYTVISTQEHQQDK